MLCKSKNTLLYLWEDPADSSLCNNAKLSTTCCMRVTKEKVHNRFSLRADSHNVFFLA